MDPIQEQRKKLEKLNDLSSAYEMKLSDYEITDYLTARGSEIAEGSMAEQTRNRIKQMMLVDTENAEALREDFSDLYDEVTEEKRQLDIKAKRKGLDKVKHDTLGHERKAANEKLKEISAKREKVESQKRKFAFFDEKKILLQQQVGLRRGQLELRLRRAPAEAKAGIQRTIEAFMNDKGGSVTDMMDQMAIGSEYGIAAKQKQDALYALTPVSKWDEERGEIVQSAYDKDVYFRDIARFTGEYNAADKADLQEMTSVAEAFFVVLYDRKPACSFQRDDSDPPKMVPVEATEEEENTAFEICREKMIEKFDQMKDFKREHEEVFQTGVDLTVAFAHYQPLNEAFKMLQITQKVGEAMLKSEAFKRLGEQEKKDVVDLCVFLSAMKRTIQTINGWMKTEAKIHNGDPSVPNPPEKEDSLTAQMNFYRMHYMGYMK